jgi:hypothetical protein
LAACQNCAAPLRDGLRFCTQCGSALLAAQHAPSASAVPAPPAVVPPLSAPPVAVPPTAAPPTPAAAGTAAAPDFDVARDFGDEAVDDPAPGFEPVPALGSLAPAPAARPSILGLLVDRGAGATLPMQARDDEVDADLPHELAAHQDAETRPDSGADAPSAVIHPLGVPVISARRPPGPGADPTHIGRASAYGTASPRMGSTATASPVSASTPSASPASASPATASSVPVASSSPASVSPASPASGSTDSAASAPDGAEQRSSAPARAPRRYTPPPARSRAATWALVTGILPLGVSIVGNLVTAELGRQALAATEAGVTSGAWAPVFVALSLVFVINAALLTVCAISGSRGIRETGNRITKGRALAVAGLAAGVVNLVLLVAGLAITISGLSTVLA